jgi:hypothetical protein
MNTRLIWRGLWITLALGTLVSTGCSGPAAEQPDQQPQTSVEQTGPNTLSEAEVTEGWRLLFDGETMEGWRGFRMDTTPPGWEVKDGALVYTGEHGGEGLGDLITAEQFDNFELSLEWKISPCGNSGVMFRVSEDYEQEYMSGPEFQVRDPSPDCGGTPDPTRAVGANYGLHPPTKDVCKPAGEWNHVRLVLNGPHVEHWMNGEKIVEYELWTDEWKSMVAETKFAEWPGYGMNKTGHLVLQDHGAPVWYRNLKIRPL